MTSAALLPDSIEARYSEVCDRVAAAAKKSGRRPEDVLIVAVSKSAEPEQIRALIELGHRDFGENRVQQLMQRAALVDEYFSRVRVMSHTRKVHADEAANNLFRSNPGRDLIPTAPVDGNQRPVRWHMIGHLQRNKARKVAEFTRLIHSVDSLRLVEELQQIALRRDQVIEVLVQVNCSGEPQKSGCAVPAALPLAEQIDSMINVKVRGLMTMAAETADPEQTRSTFARCRDLFEEIRSHRLSEGRFNILSMGMSNDFEVAISEGANMVRIGSAIFGSGKAAPDDEREAAEDED